MPKKCYFCANKLKIVITLRDWDLVQLFHFVKHPGMYIRATKSNTYKAIDQFLVAYEMGSKYKCQFREKLIAHIEDQYQVSCPSEGLSKQLQLASQKAQKDLPTFWEEEATAVLIKESDTDFKHRFINQYRKILIDYLSTMPNEINFGWAWAFAQKIKNIIAWKGVNLTNEEYRLSMLIIEQLSSLKIAGSAMVKQSHPEVYKNINGLLQNLKRNKAN